MSMIARQDRHFWITRSVARVMGINLTEAMAEARLSAEEYCEMVAICANCGRVQACHQWLAQQVTEASEPPEGCPNRRDFIRLAGARR